MRITFDKEVKMIVQSSAGLVAFAVLAWIISENRNKISLKTV
jgi:nucleoside permease NupC